MTSRACGPASCVAALRRGTPLGGEGGGDQDTRLCGSLSGPRHLPGGTIVQWEQHLDLRVQGWASGCWELVVCALGVLLGQ